MIRLCFVSLFLLYSSSALADCNYFDGTKTSTIPEGTAVSLRTAGNSLDKMTIQDQDGLGTCYANATTTILKSVLPTHPDISYSHAAIMGTTKGWSENWSSGKNKYISKDDTNVDNFTGGGYVCETIAGMKKAGGACPRNLSVTENVQLWDSDVQERLFNGLGAYFDNVNLIKNDPAKFEQLKKDLSFSIEAINVEKANLIQICEERKSIKFPIFAAAKSLIEDNYYSKITDPTVCNIAKAEALKKFLAPESKISDDRLEIVPSTEVLALFTEMLESDPAINNDLEKYMADPDAGLSNFPELSKKVAIKLNAFFLTNLPDEEVKNACVPIAEGQSPFLNGDMKDLSESFIFLISYNKTNPCKDLLAPYAIKDLLDPGYNPNSCIAPANLEAILGAIKPLMELEAPIDQQLISTLLNPEARYADQIVKALMPGCLDPAKLIALNDIACAGFPFCDRTGGFNDSFTYSGPTGGCYSFEHARKMVRTKSLIGINQGRALGVSVCTNFMNEPDIKTNFCNTFEEGKEPSFHEMAITGYRCKDNNIEYEMTNSWGSNCPETKNTECQKDEYENPTGPFWIKESTFVDNTRDITTISVKKK